jgi:Stress responsive A/B Barrel Domain
MVKHIVFWRLKKELSGPDRQAAYARIKAGFEALPGKIPGLLKIQIGMDYGQGPDASDIVLYSEFDSRASLAGYEAHDLHTALVPMVRDVRTEKRVVDFEL